MDAISNQHGIKFEQLFYDEALDGLDDSLKIKAISMFEKLATTHNSVYIVEHSESVKAMINDKIEVRLVTGESQLEEA
jgi:ABC-type molybdenum transport system ATPase subunit/photorepair protein PhrA